VAEFRYQAHGWPRARRFVVVRRPIPDDPVEAKQLTLFKDRRYGYSVFVTNLELAPWHLWKFYQPRARIEKNIRELLYDLPLGKIPSGDWVANVAFFQLVLFAYDLVHWFRRLCLPAPYQKATVETVRSDFLVLPARLVRRAGRNVLQLPRDYFHREAFVAAFQKAAKLRLPEKICICTAPTGQHPMFPMVFTYEEHSSRIFEVKGFPQALAQLMDDRLGHQRQGHLPEPDVEVQGASSLPAEVLIEAKELLDVPTIGKIGRQG
jgi:hypothetical protein